MLAAKTGQKQPHNLCKIDGQQKNTKLELAKNAKGFLNVFFKTINNLNICQKSNKNKANKDHNKGATNQDSKSTRKINTKLSKLYQKTIYTRKHDNLFVHNRLKRA